MIAKYTCPFCYEKFGKSQIEFRCENDSTTSCQEDDAKLGRYFGGGRQMANRVIPRATWKELWQRKHFFGFFRKTGRSIRVPNKVTCEKCNIDSRKRICPHCHNELPTYFHKAQSHIISIIGARASGKTHYITVLINELMKNGYKLKISTLPQDVGEDRNEVTTKRYQRLYKNPLINNKEELTKTAESTQAYYPLIYQISSDKKGWNKMKSLYLAFYDTAGESFNDSQAVKKFANYVNNSSGIIFLLDTFQVPPVKKALEAKGLRVPSNGGVEFRDVLTQLLGSFLKEGVVKNNAISKIPMALTFSKIDEVIKKGLLNDDLQDFIIRKNSEYLEKEIFSKEELEEVSNDMRSLLTIWEQKDFIVEVERIFSKHAYFGVSALGSTPVGGKLNEELKPHRVLDPLLWILDNIGFALPKK